MQAQEIMTRNPACALPSDSLMDVAQRMKDCDCGLLPVVDSSKDMHLLGVVTDRDIVVRVLAQGMDCNTATVQDAMTIGNIWMVKPADDINMALQEMERGQIRRIPVVDNSNCVVGILSMADIARRLEQEKSGEVISRISQPGSGQSRRAA